MHFHLADLDSGALSTGSAWYYLLNAGAQLEHALTQYALARAMSRGWAPVAPPDVVHAAIGARCGFAPRDAGGAAQLFELGGHAAGLVLAATAEVPLAVLFAGRTLDAAALENQWVLFSSDAAKECSQTVLQASQAQAAGYGNATRRVRRPALRAMFYADSHAQMG